MTPELVWAWRALAVACLIDLSTLVLAVLIVRRRRRRRWAVRPVVAGQAGAVSAIRITPEQLRRKVGNPFEDES